MNDQTPDPCPLHPDTPARWATITRRFPNLQSDWSAVRHDRESRCSVEGCRNA